MLGFICHTDQGTWYVNERGDWGVAGAPDAPGSFPAISVSGDTYNKICANQQAIFKAKYPGAPQAEAPGTVDALAVRWQQHLATVGAK